MSAADSIDNYADVIDSRDVIARIEYLESIENDDDPESFLDEDETDELTKLRALASEGEALADWVHGETLIRESWFENYAREFASDMYGDEISAARWPFSCIDWEEAADELRQDYTSIDFDGVTYYGR